MNMIEALNAYNSRILEINEALPKLEDKIAITVKELFPIWAPDIDYALDFRVRHDNKLWKVRQAHTSSSLYPPGAIGTEALYAEVEKPGQGDTPDDPIPYSNNMELFEGKYYSQDGSIYYCFRSTGVPVYNPLSALVGIYVELYTEG